jgi:hypothetical protein
MGRDAIDTQVIELITIVFFTQETTIIKYMESVLAKICIQQ